MAATVQQQLVYATLLVLGVWVSQAMSRKLHDASSSMVETHEQWMSQFGRTYDDPTKKEWCFNIFKANVEYIDWVNKCWESIIQAKHQ